MRKPIIPSILVCPIVDNNPEPTNMDAPIVYVGRPKVKQMPPSNRRERRKQKRK